MSTTITHQRKVVERLAPWGTVIALGFLILIFGIAKPHEFLSGGNVQTILSAAAGLAVVAAGLTVVLICGDFDLSVGAVATASGFVAALLARDGTPVIAAIALALLLGIVIGSINGLVVVLLNVSSFIATLAMLTIATGLATWWSHSESAAITNQGFLNLALKKVIGIPLPALIAIGLYALLWVILERTRPGRMFYAAGANPEAARLVGIRAGATRVAAFATCSLLASIAGVLLAARLSAAYEGAGTPYLLNAFAAAFLGAVTLRVGQFHILGTAVGILLLTVLTNGLDVISAPSYVAQLISGCILVAAVALAGIRARNLRGGSQAVSAAS